MGVLVAFVGCCHNGCGSQLDGICDPGRVEYLGRYCAAVVKVEFALETVALDQWIDCQAEIVGGLPALGCDNDWNLTVLEGIVRRRHQGNNGFIWEGVVISAVGCLECAFPVAFYNTVLFWVWFWDLREDSDLKGAIGDIV